MVIVSTNLVGSVEHNAFRISDFQMREFTQQKRPICIAKEAGMVIVSTNLVGSVDHNAFRISDFGYRI